jgi:transcriptional antiterminator RfaH
MKDEREAHLSDEARSVRRSDIPSLRWYVAQTQPHKDHGVANQLAAQGFKHFLPQLLKTTRHARKLITKRAPLFPGYLFVRLDLDHDRWRSVNGTFGVVRMIMNGDLPGPVPPGIVEALQANSDSFGLLRCGLDLFVGGKVKIVLGPLTGGFGVVERLDDNGRVRVLLDLMNGKVPVRLSRSSLRSMA